VRGNTFWRVPDAGDIASRYRNEEPGRDPVTIIGFLVAVSAFVHTGIF